MKPHLIAIAIFACLSLVPAEKTLENSSLANQEDLIAAENQEAGDPKIPESQRKRDSGYTYTRPERVLTIVHQDQQPPVIIRARILGKRPSLQSPGRPFERYGPPRYRLQSIGQRDRPSQQSELHISLEDSPRGQAPGIRQQKVPSPTRDYEFVEPSPIAGQNNIPFSSNSANYLPPKNQKLPAHTDPHGFANHEQPARLINDNPHQQAPRNQQQSLRLNHQPEKLLRESPHRYSQISDAASFLAQNSQAIAQLWEAPATNFNYEPIQDPGASLGSSQTAVDPPTSGSPQAPQRFTGVLPSYASGILQRDALLDIQSLEKDRLITQLQQALLAKDYNEVSSNPAIRYAQNHDDTRFNKIQSLSGSQDRMNPSPAPQLDRPSASNHQRPAYGSSGFSSGSFNPLLASSASGYNYGFPSTTPADLTPPTTLAQPTTVSPPTQRPPHRVDAVASTVDGNSVPAPAGSPSFQLPQFSGFVPSLVNDHFLNNYPTYPTHFLASGSSVINHQPATAPTHFAIPIPSLPAIQQTSNTLPPPKPSNSFALNHHGAHAVPIQPINPLPTASVHTGFSVFPASTPVHPLHHPTNNVAHPTYGLQPTAVDPLLVKPPKPVYPVYYYPNVYQLQKPGFPTLPWNYAPSYTQTRPSQAWK